MDPDLERLACAALTMTLVFHQQRPADHDFDRYL